MEKSKILAQESIVLFADLQFGIADLPLTVPGPVLRRGVLAMAKLAKLTGIPAIATIVGGDGTGRLIDEIEQGYGPIETVVRTTADSFQNEVIRDKLEALGRKTLLICGVATELAVSLPAMSGTDHGYRTYVAVDACGGVSARTERCGTTAHRSRRRLFYISLYPGGRTGGRFPRANG